MAILKEREIGYFLDKNLKWKLEDRHLVREWTFENFIQSIEFVNRVAIQAEAANHHPEILIRYNRVRLALRSHDVGGITARDIGLAEKLE